MKITLYGKENCDSCKRAIEKLNLMKLDFKKVDFDEFIEDLDNWREDNSVDIMAAYTYYQTLPIIQIDNMFVSYPVAMRILKRQGNT